jgi:cysteine desulfurase/selenocysteine lyase
MDLSRTASKLDASLAWFPAMSDQAGLGIFRRFGISALLDRNAQLAAHLQDALTSEGVSFYPRSPESRSTIFSVKADDAETILARFNQFNVIASVRSDRIRLAVHFYNVKEELSKVAELVSRS